MQLYRNSIMKNHSCLHAVFVLALAMLFFACTSPFGGWGALKPGGVFSQADSLMNHRPDSALQLLETLLPDTNTMSKRDLMRFHLLRTNAQNKCDTVFTARHATLMHRVCDYYDHKSSPRGGREGVANSRMLAHYLLGRCYSDMGEAPAALQEFHNAADAADTTRTDCDKSLLLRIYGQTASIFIKQEAPLAALEEMRNAECTAHAICDTIFLLINREQMAVVYDMLGMSDSVIAIRKEVYEQFQRLGMDGAAAKAVAPAIDNALSMGRWNQARQFAQIYESTYNLFENGRVKEGYEQYLYTKGMMFLHERDLLMAEKCFSQLAKKASSFADLESAYRGLSETNRIAGKLDSAAIYAQKALSMNDSVYKNATANFYQRMQASHNYLRLQQVAEKEKIEKEHTRWVLTTYIMGSLVVICLILFLLYILIRKNREHKRLENELEDKYQQLQDELQEFKALRELDDTSAKSLVDAKFLKIENLKSEIAIKENLLASRSLLDGTKFKTIVNPEINTFKKKYSHHFEDVTNEEWERVKNIMNEEVPTFFATLDSSNPELREEEMRVCILIRIQVPLKDIYTSMHCTSQYLSVMRKRMLAKVFQDHIGGAKDFDKLLMSLS